MVPLAALVWLMAQTRCSRVVEISPVYPVQLHEVLLRSIWIKVPVSVSPMRIVAAFPETNNKTYYWAYDFIKKRLLTFYKCVTQYKKIPSAPSN